MNCCRLQQLMLGLLLTGLSGRLWAQELQQDGKIVNGTTAKQGEFPFALSLRRVKSGSHSCGASLLNSGWAMTAAHCVRGATPAQLNLQYGSNKLRRNATQLAAIAAIYVHPDYQPQDKHMNDIALLQLQLPLNFNELVQPVRLPQPQQPTLGNTSVVLVGWGLNATGGVVQKHLQKVELQVFSDEDCSNRHQTQLFDTQLCAGVPEGGKGQCSGDSGGPLLLAGTDTQVGIVSWSIKPCTRPPYPGVFTEVSAYVDWIVKLVGSTAKSVPTSQLWIQQLLVGRQPPPALPATQS
ncbi:trypsin-1 [Drosophila busckii]|uniref:trypsin-1 n=1 Tax=Drosophila busckii TaxID=30019 RepID=UPI00083EF191|nr:trypsin-1 [Drosophila busckii]